MKVHLFGRLADYGGRVLDLAAPAGGCSLAELHALVAANRPSLGQALSGPGVRAWLGRTPLGADDRVRDEDTVEFWPPVSGG